MMSSSQLPPQAMRTEQNGNQVLHVRNDSDSDLDALFSVLTNSKPPLSSFKNRKLPASFFQPPEPRAMPAGHTGCVAIEQMNYGTGHLHRTLPSNAVSGGLHGMSGVSHCRSLSSPAQMMMPHANLDPVSHHHHQHHHPQHINKHGGVEGFAPDEFASMQSNWEINNKCPRYFLNNNSPGIWPHDLHTSSHINAHNGPHLNGHGQIVPHPHSQHSADFSLQDIGPLPRGWEEGMTPEGETYFINHIDKTTSWYDPRIPRHVPNMSPHRINPTHQPMLSPKQQQQQQQCQQQQCQLMNQQLMSNNISQPTRRPSPSEHFLYLELQKLQKEKEKLQHEQEAIACREMMLTELVRQSSTTSPPSTDGGCLQSSGASLSLAQAMQSGAPSSGVDPFLGQGATTLETHVRQNSTDSGLGGMGTAYSLPRSPEDYLSNVDEMDVPETENKLQQQQQQQQHPHPHPRHPQQQQAAPNSCYAMTDIQTRMHMEIAAQLTDNSLMDGDHLVSSLSEDMSSDLLNDMDVQKIDNMLWI